MDHHIIAILVQKAAKNATHLFNAVNVNQIIICRRGVAI